MDRTILKSKMLSCLSRTIAMRFFYIFILLCLYMLEMEEAFAREGTCIVLEASETQLQKDSNDNQANNKRRCFFSKAGEFALRNTAGLVCDVGTGVAAGAVSIVGTPIDLVRGNRNSSRDLDQFLKKYIVTDFSMASPLIYPKITNAINQAGYIIAIPIEVISASSDEILDFVFGIDPIFYNHLRGSGYTPLSNIYNNLADLRKLEREGIIDQTQIFKALAARVFIFSGETALNLTALPGGVIIETIDGLVLETGYGFTQDRENRAIFNSLFSFERQDFDDIWEPIDPISLYRKSEHSNGLNCFDNISRRSCKAKRGKNNNVFFSADEELSCEKYSQYISEFIYGLFANSCIITVLKTSPEAFLQYLEANPEELFFDPDTLYEWRDSIPGILSNEFFCDALKGARVIAQQRVMSHIPSGLNPDLGIFIEEFLNINISSSFYSCENMLLDFMTTGENLGCENLIKDPYFFHIRNQDFLNQIKGSPSEEFNRELGRSISKISESIQNSNDELSQCMVLEVNAPSFHFRSIPR